MTATRLLLLTALVLLFSVGCSKKGAEESADASQSVSVDETAATTTRAASGTARWRELPDALQSSQIGMQYSRTVKEESSGMINMLGLVGYYSLLVGAQLEDEGQEEGFAFFLQAGDAMRASSAAQEQGVPDEIFRETYYQEARAHAHAGDFALAKTRIGDAFELGFSDEKMLLEEELFASLREDQGFAESLIAWKVKAKERLIARSKAELAKGETFPFELDLVDIYGTQQNLKNYLGKVVIVDVWGTWCPPCCEEIPHFIELQEKLGPKGFQMLGVNMERYGDDEKNHQAVVDFVAAKGVNYPCMLGHRKLLNQIPKFNVYPTTLFIDKGGRVRLKSEGALGYSELETYVELLLNE